MVRCSKRQIQQEDVGWRWFAGNWRPTLLKTSSLASLGRENWEMTSCLEREKYLLFMKKIWEYVAHQPINYSFHIYLIYFGSISRFIMRRTCIFRFLDVLFQQSSFAAMLRYTASTCLLLPKNSLGDWFERTNCKYEYRTVTQKNLLVNTIEEYQKLQCSYIISSVV